ncbi:MAG: hypothetical protein OPY06_04980 [Nitrosopumilus sp.]|nr:hypothetical protein [Nitrosopumilus sp.]MDF2423188.1 hypothetical protein [Nitrosopumilus sp.]MDF2426029.1 hypothetical protein [Nitrosopumilus sp.]MDF2427501.1 hypothetical protein [Nitrosopumilus sp.]MDF2427623.1 hypothetical protein [Nitrosopumilus sp.]
MEWKKTLSKFCVMKKVRDKANEPNSNAKKSESNAKKSENIASEQEEMREEQHELDLKENYESDEKYDESKD